METLEHNLLHRASLGDLLSRSADRFGTRIALQTDEVTVSFSEVNEKACIAGNAFLNRGIGRGDRVAFISHNCLDYIYLRLGLSKIGAIPVPLNFMLRGEEIGFILKDCEPKMIFVEDRLITEIQGLHEQLPFVQYYGSFNFDNSVSLPEQWIDSTEMFSNRISREEPLVEIATDDTASIMYTTGTESFPKGVMTSHLNYFMSMLHMSCDCDIRRDEVLIIDIPLFHIAGTTILLSALTFGAKAIIGYEPDPVKILQKTQDEKVTMWVYPPTLYHALPMVPNFNEFDISSLKKCITFGAAMPKIVLETWKNIHPDIQWRNYWGQTESSPVGTTSAPEDFELKMGSIGLPDTGMTVRVMDDEGKVLPAGKKGELVMRGPAVMQGYWRRGDLTEETFKNGWLHTGDIGYMDEDGYIFFSDRKKDMIKSGGENVSSQEVEGIILKHPQVAMAAVIGLPHEHWMEAVTAFVVPKPGETLTEQELISFCKVEMAAYKVPKLVYIRESLPVTSTGKILKRKIRDEIMAQSS